MAKTVTSLKIEEDVIKKAKIKCIQKGILFQEGVEQALKEWLKSG